MRAIDRNGQEAARERPRWPARLSLRFSVQGERTIVRRTHEGPLVMQRALYPEGPRICHAIVLHPPGGVAAGDDLHLRLDLEPGSRALLTSPGMTKWYRSEGDYAEQRMTAMVDGGVLEWLPPGGIVFDGARARMHLEVELLRGGRFLGWEITGLGRAASGERFGRGLIRRHTTIRRDGSLLLCERGVADAGSPFFASPVGLRGATVSATFYAAGRDPGEALVEECRRIGPEEGAGVAGVSALPGLLIGQYLGDSTEMARRWLSAIWQVVRPALVGLPAVPPRIWST